MRLRTATHTDAPAIAKLHANSWRFAYRGVLADAYLATEADRDRLRLWDARLSSPAPNQNVFVLEKDSSLLGFACVFVDHHPEFGSYLNNLHVSHELIGQGLGARLMSAARDCCSRFAPARPVYLWVVESNARARKFYFRFGAKFSGSTQWEPPGGGAALLHRLAWTTPDEIDFTA